MSMSFCMGQNSPKNEQTRTRFMDRLLRLGPFEYFVCSFFRVCLGNTRKQNKIKVKNYEFVFVLFFCKIGPAIKLNC